MRYGILGGSFDPVHAGHLAAAEAVRAGRDLDAVFLVVSARPPHKAKGCAAPFADRVAMARLAVRGRPGLVVLDLEGRREGPSYTIDTVDELKRAHPGAAFELLLGSDMLADFPGWREAGRLVAEVTVVGFARPGADRAAAERVFTEAFGPGSFERAEVPAVAASATEIRRKLARGEDLGEAVPAAVLAYIREKGLYERG